MEKNPETSKTLPAWFTAVARPTIIQIRGQHAVKKQNTVLAVAASRALSIPIDWKRKDIAVKRYGQPSGSTIPSLPRP